MKKFCSFSPLFDTLFLRCYNREAGIFRFGEDAMAKFLSGSCKAIFLNLFVFLKWAACACLIGLVMGGVGTLFHYSMVGAEKLRLAQPWLLWLLPLGGLLILWLYKIAGMDQDRGTNLMLVAIRSNERLTIKTAPMIFLGTVITHLLGGSAGREGAALQMGGSISAKIGRWLGLDEKDERTITMCGMSAAFAALFGTPMAAAVFAMEVISVGVMYYAAIVPCVIAAIVGFSVACALGVPPPHFFLQGIPLLSLANAGRVVLLAILCAGLSILFCLILHKVMAFYHKYLPQAQLRIVVGGLLLIGLTYLVGNFDYNGLGSAVIERAVNTGQALPEAFLLKILFTAVTLGAGFKGGEIVPAFFTGATFGNVAGGFLGLNPSFGAGIGMVAVFCGVTNCPLTSFFISIELFGAEGLLLFGLACAVSYMLSGYYGLYSEQKILYSKIKPEFIDKKTE